MSVFVLVRGGCARRRDPARGDARRASGCCAATPI